MEYLWIREGYSTVRLLWYGCKDPTNHILGDEKQGTQAYFVPNLWLNSWLVQTIVDNELQLVLCNDKATGNDSFLLAFS